jgi:hypothetical protein
MHPQPWILCGVLLAVFSSMACSSSEGPGASTPSPAGASVTTPPAQDPPAAVVCGDGSYRTTQNTCETFPALTVQRSTAVISPVRDHHATTVVETAAGPYLYVFGGTDDWTTLHEDAQRARIHDDGTLDAFELVGHLPAPRAGHCLVKVKDRYLLAGGILAGGARMGVSATTVFVTLGADGKVTATAPGPDLPKAVMHLTCDVDGDFVYALGGRGTDSKSTTMSARARIGADGSLGSFEAQTALKPDRSHHAAFIREKRVYVVGGLTGDPTSTNIVDHSDAIMATIGDDGALGAWSAAGTLPASLSVSSAQLYKDAVYLVGGLEGNTAFSDQIRRATFNEDGTLTAFATLPSKLPAPRGHVHQTPMWKSFFFSVGGKDDDQKSLGTVDIGSFQ